MRKLLAAALVLATGVLLLAAGPASAAGKAYVNGIDSNYPPFAYVDEKTGKPAGFDVDALDWIAKTMGFEVTHKPVAWDGIIPALQAKQIDMIASGMSITEKRRQVVDFTRPYWTLRRVMVVRKDSDLTAESILKSKVKLGVQRGTSEAEAIKTEQKKEKYPFELRFYESAPLIVTDLLNGRIDAGFMDQLPAEDSIAKGNAVRIAGTHGDVDTFGVAVRKGEDDLRKTLEEGYAKLMADPYWQELQKKYLNK